MGAYLLFFDLELFDVRMNPFGPKVDSTNANIGTLKPEIAKFIKLYLFIVKR